MAVLWDGQSGCGVSDQAFVFETYSKNCSGLQSVVVLEYNNRIQKS